MGLRNWLSEQFRAPIGTMQAQPAVQFGMVIPPEMLEAMTSGGGIAPRISRAQALQVPAVLRSRNLICGSLSTLPIRVHDPARRVVTTVPYLVPQPDPEIASSVVMAQTIEDLLFEGVAWWRVTRFGPGPRPFPLEATHVLVDAVHVVPTRLLRPSEVQISPDQPFPVDGQVFIDGLSVPDREIIRFDSPNPPLLQHAARAIRTCLLLDTAAATYAKEPLPLGFFTPADGADPANDDDVQDMLDDWEAMRARRAWAYVPAAVKANTLQWNPEQLQLADQRQHAVLEIARATGVDPEYLGVSTTTRTYANSEQRRQDLIDFTLGSYVSAIQDRLSMRDVLPRGFVARIDFAGFLRGDTKTRMDQYKVGREVGAYADENEIRELEYKPNLTPAQRTARARSTAPPVPPPGKASAMADPVEFAAREELARERAARIALEGELAELRERVEKLSALADQWASGPAPRRTTDFDAGETTRIHFDAVDTHDFQVDEQRRTVVGLLVPWGKVASNGFAKWRFAEDSVHWSEVNRIKLNLHHDDRELIGVATRLQSASRGLMGTFRVGRGAEGDRALEKAADGILDGFSMEVVFESVDSWQPDPTDESVRLVRDATLRGAALTGTPAFDDARLTGVKASRETGVRNGSQDQGSGSLRARAGTEPRDDTRGAGRPRVRVRFRGVHQDAR